MGAMGAFAPMVFEKTGKCTRFAHTGLKKRRLLKICTHGLTFLKMTPDIMIDCWYLSKLVCHFFSV